MHSIAIQLGNGVVVFGTLEKLQDSDRVSIAALASSRDEATYTFYTPRLVSRSMFIEVIDCVLRVYPEHKVSDTIPVPDVLCHKARQISETDVVMPPEGLTVYMDDLENSLRRIYTPGFTLEQLSVENIIKTLTLRHYERAMRDLFNFSTFWSNPSISGLFPEIDAQKVCATALNLRREIGEEYELFCHKAVKLAMSEWEKREIHPQDVMRILGIKRDDLTQQEAEWINFEAQMLGYGPVLSFGPSDPVTGKVCFDFRSKRRAS